VLEKFATRIVDMILAGIHREYPNQVALVLAGPEDARPPRSHTPAFYGCYDWHSAVHAHWSLVRLLRLLPASSWNEQARAELADSLTAENLAAELVYLQGPGREGFERPYGLAWLLQLCAELREWDDPRGDGRVWLQRLRGLEELASRRLAEWLPKLRYPIRSGEHSQTAFAMGLALDWSRAAGDTAFGSVVCDCAQRLYGDDVDAPLRYEPSEHDFLSPILGEADLMRRVVTSDEFAAWWSRLVRGPESQHCRSWLTPPDAAEVRDGKRAHRCGLLLSRVWMLENIADALPQDDAWILHLKQAAQAHMECGLTALEHDAYALTHWIGTFAVYLLSKRGSSSPTTSDATR